jgi:hypothetical protein
MDKQIAMILAGATLALGFGGYLMASNMGEYDLDKDIKSDAARVERLETDDGKGPGLLAALWDKANTSLETSRNVYLGEFFPPTPEGWVLKKTHHDEIVDFTVDYKLDLNINDKSSMRRLAGWGGQNLARSTDLAYRKDDKVIFMRLVYANKPLKTPLSNAHAWMFVGSPTKGADITLGGATFETRQYEGTDLINIASETGYYTGIGIFTNASLAEVESLLDSMDMYGFASQTGNPDGGAAVPFLTSSNGQGLQTMQADVQSGDDTPALKRDPKPSPSGNLLSGLSGGDDSDVETAVEEKPKKKRKNLLSSLLGGGDDAGSILPKRDKKKKGKSASAFKRVGNFTSRCKSGGGAKKCRVGE